MDFVREGRCHQRASAFSYLLPPLSLMSIASFLKQNNYKVEIEDCIANKTSYKELEKEIKRFDPDLVISNAATSSIYGDLKIGEITNKLEIPTAIIGVFGSVKDRWCLENSKIDFVIRNEPEETALDLAESVKNKESIEKVKGITWRKKDKIVRNERRKFIQDTSKFSVKARDMIDSDKYTMPFSNQPLALVTSSRGCPYSCTFCTASIYYGKDTRFRSPEDIFEEMRRCKERGIKNVALWGETYTSNKKYILELSKILKKEKLDVDWYLTSRVDKVDKKMLEKMKEGGCKTLMLGVESGSQKILNRAKKGIKLNQTVKAVEKAKEAGLQTFAHMIFGLPGETRKTMEKSKKFAFKLNPDFFNFYCAVPFPGTEFYKEAKEKEWIETYDWDRYEINQSIVSYPKLSGREIEKFRRNIFMSFYSRPNKILNTFLKSEDKVSLIKDTPKFIKEWVFK